MSPGIA
jgi:hypothetical protein